jgi:methylglutaconyl-CoA hydratase
MKKMAKYTKEENEMDSHSLFDMFKAIRDAPIPTIARVNGAALGGGAGLVAACDISIGGLL